MTQTNDTQSSQSQNSRQKAVVQAVLLFGLVSCFGDIIYEGARSANGQYFSLLSVSAATVGTLYGFGEFLGYVLRLVSGRISDFTGRHWALIFLGYGTLIVVPLMGMTRSVPVLFALFLIERIGKALRNPPKDTILSQVAENQWAPAWSSASRRRWTSSGPLPGRWSLRRCSSPPAGRTWPATSSATG